MMEAMFYQAVCLPPALDVCHSDPTNPDGVQTIADARMQNSLYAIQEVQQNLSVVQSCACPCKSYKVIAMRTDSPGVSSSTSGINPAQLQSFSFNIDGNTYLTHGNVYNDDNKSLPIDEFVYADRFSKPAITSDASGNIGLDFFFGVPGDPDLSFELIIKERDSDKIFRAKGVLSDLYDSSACGTYEKDITLASTDIGGTITVRIEVNGKGSCPTVSSVVHPEIRFKFISIS